MPNVKSYVLGGAVTLGFFRGFCGARCEVVGSKIKSGFFSMVMVFFFLALLGCGRSNRFDSNHVDLDVRHVVVRDVCADNGTRGAFGGSRRSRNGINVRLECWREGVCEPPRGSRRWLCMSALEGRTLTSNRSFAHGRFLALGTFERA